MNSTAAKFLKWRENPPPPKEAKPKARRPYPHTGWLSVKETKMERAGRLIEAIAAGFYLTRDDFAWLKNHTIANARAIERREAKVHVKFAHIMGAINHSSARVIGGFQ